MSYKLLQQTGIPQAVIDHCIVPFTGQSEAVVRENHSKVMAELFRGKIRKGYSYVVNEYLWKYLDPATEWMPIPARFVALWNKVVDRDAEAQMFADRVKKEYYKSRILEDDLGREFQMTAATRCAGLIALLNPEQVATIDAAIADAGDNPVLLQQRLDDLEEDLQDKAWMTSQRMGWIMRDNGKQQFCQRIFGSDLHSGIYYLSDKIGIHCNVHGDEMHRVRSDDADFKHFPNDNCCRLRRRINIQIPNH